MWPVGQAQSNHLTTFRLIDSSAVNTRVDCHDNGLDAEIVMVCKIIKLGHVGDQSRTTVRLNAAK